jgi:hypothetical protein
MKQILFSFFVILSLAGCAGELTKEQSEMVYSHSVQISKADLKIKILSFINENYVSGKSVLQINEDGLISGNVISQFALLSKLEYSFIIKYQDSTYKVKCVVKRIIGYNDRDVDYSDWGNYANKVKKEFDAFDNKLLAYLSKKTDDF